MLNATKVKKVKVDKTQATRSYTTRHLEVRLLEEIRLIAALMRPQRTLEYAFNEVLRAGLPIVHEKLGNVDEVGAGVVEADAEEEE